VFLFGLLGGLFSCSILELPFLIAMVSSAKTKWQVFNKTLAFMLGLIFSYIVIGIFFTQIAKFISKNMFISTMLLYLLGIIGILWGLKIILNSGKHEHCCSNHQHCDHEHKHNLLDKLLHSLKPKSYAHIFIIGALFAWIETPVCPCCGPILYILAALTIAKGKLIFGITTFFIYSLGQAIPVLICTVFFTNLLSHPKLVANKKYFDLLLGNLLLFLGGVFLWLT
jgi:cytochrome c biogenesis protein CcdA